LNISTNEKNPLQPKALQSCTRVLLIGFILQRAVLAKFTHPQSHIHSTTTKIDCHPDAKSYTSQFTDS